MTRLVRIAAVLGAVLFLCRCWLMLGLRFQLEYGEGHMLGLAYFLKKGQSIYTPGAEPPYVFGIQLPLYLWMVGWGTGPTPSFFPARFVSVVASLTMLVASAAWLGRRQGLTCACAGLAFLLLHPLILGWGSLARADNLGLCFSVLAILLTRRLPSLLMSWLAFLTKQSFLAAPLAIGISQKPKPGALFLFAYGVGAVALYQGLNHFLFSGRLPGSLQLVSDWPAAWALWLSYLPGVLLLGGLACLAPGQSPEVRRLRAYALTSLIPVAACVKQGTFYNYFLELHWALSMLAALAVGSRLTYALALVQMVIGTFTQLPILKSPFDHWRYDTLACLAGRDPAWVRSIEANSQLGPILEAHPGPVLAEQCGNPLIFGREPIVCDCYALLNVLPSAGAWDPAPLLDRLRRREIAVILLQRLDASNLRVPLPFLQVIMENYQVVGRIEPGGDYILLPRNPGEK